MSLKQFMNSVFAKKCITKYNKIKRKLLSLPSDFVAWWVAFGLSFVNTFKMMPKMVRYTYKNINAKVINLPNSTVSYFKKIGGYRFKDFQRILYNNAIFIALIMLILYIIIKDTHFFKVINLTKIINQSGTKLIVALGVGTIIVARGTDLSAGRTVGITSFVGMIFSQKLMFATNPDLAGANPLLILIITFLLGAAFGIINGIVVAKLNVTPFIATLGSMLIIYGLNQWLYLKFNKGSPVGAIADRYTDFGFKGWSWGERSYISWIAIIAFALAFVMWIIWTKLPWGRKLFAVGGNPQAAAVSGIAVPTILITAYMIGGGFYGLAGTLEGWRIGSVTSGTGNMYELDAIAACIVGGLSFDGGRGKISGIIIGVLLFQTITYGFNFIGTSGAVSMIIRGVIIVLSVAVDGLKTRVKK